MEATEVGGRARTLTDSALAMQVEGRFAEAAEGFSAALESEPSAFRASRLLYCLRKTSVQEARRAVALAEQWQDQWGHDPWFRREHVWSLYSGHLKVPREGAASSGSDGPAVLEDALAAARKILALSDEPMPRRLAVFAAAKVARAHHRWQEALELVEALDPADLSAAPQQIEGRSVPSDLERWHNLKARALYELGRYPQSLEACAAALRDLPSSIALQRIDALATLASGSPEEGLARLVALNRRSPRQWYILGDIAKAHQALGHPAEAIRWAAEALTAPGSLEVRIGTIELIGDLLAETGDWRWASQHVALACAIASHEGWQRRADRDAETLAGLLGRGGEPETHLGAALRLCRDFWHEQCRAALPRGTGSVKVWNQERGFGFIRTDEGSELYFRAKDVCDRGREPRPGLLVEFEVREAFDAKRGCEALAAVNVRLR